MTAILEYIWIDGNGDFRSKTKTILQERYNFKYIKENDILNNPEYYWNFDGSSTNQSVTEKSDLLLIPVFICKNPFYAQAYDMNNSARVVTAYLVLCDVWIDINTPHPTNTHVKLAKYYEDKKVCDFEPWFGIEQEYFIMQHNPQTNNPWNTPYGWKADKDGKMLAPYGDIQGPYYCSVGSKNNLGREIVDEHMLKCLESNIKICGVNAEVAPSQWEFQIGICEHLDIANHLIVARYILERVAEKHGCWINYHPKPIPGFNGSGCHTNFSTKKMREEGGIKFIKNAIDKLAVKHREHIEVYGKDNDMRLTGIHETSSIDEFSMGDCNRGSSIRIPINVMRDKKGYFEDRRPAANMDPYLVCSKLIETIIMS
jgi:glutamine synthetase